jgi:hypothetical protein
MRAGKPEGYYVDKRDADSIENNSVGRNLAELSGLRFMNSTLFRPLFITFNVGFQTTNLQRDFWRSWKNDPVATVAQVAKSYLDPRVLRLAKVRVFGQGKSAADAEAAAVLRQLEDERLRSEMYLRMIEIAETEYKVPIRKKPGTK